MNAREVIAQALADKGDVPTSWNYHQADAALAALREHCNNREFIDALWQQFAIPAHMQRAYADALLGEDIEPVDDLEIKGFMANAHIRKRIDGYVDLCAACSHPFPCPAVRARVAESIGLSPQEAEDFMRVLGEQ
jgi:hypothetical protein